MDFNEIHRNVVARPMKATLHVELSDGASYDVTLDSVSHLDVKHGIADNGYCSESGFKRYVPSGTSTLSIVGHIGETVDIYLHKKVKPVPKPKKPSVKASAERVRKATVNAFKLAKRLADAERILLEIKRGRESVDVELKIAREQLLASATPETR